MAQTLEEVIGEAIRDYQSISGRYDWQRKTKPFLHEYIAVAVRAWMIEEGYLKTPPMTCYYCHQDVDEEATISFTSKQLVTIGQDVCTKCEAVHKGKLR